MSIEPETLLVVPLSEDPPPKRAPLKLEPMDPMLARQAPHVPRRRSCFPAGFPTLAGLLVVAGAVAAWVCWDALAAAGRKLLQVLA